MSKLILVVVAWLLNGQIQATVYEVHTCPPKGLLEYQYDLLKEKGKINEWVAWCISVPWEPTIKKDLIL